MEAGERRAGPRAMARDRAHMAASCAGAERPGGAWIRARSRVGQAATRHGFLRLFSARSMMLIAYSVNL